MRKNTKNMCQNLWRKIWQQSDYYTQLCNYKEEFVFNIISNQSNIIILNIKFH